jgi:hypothetical protein
MCAMMEKFLMWFIKTNTELLEQWGTQHKKGRVSIERAPNQPSWATARVGRPL